MQPHPLTYTSRKASPRPASLTPDLGEGWRGRAADKGDQPRGRPELGLGTRALSCGLSSLLGRSQRGPAAPVRGHGKTDRYPEPPRPPPAAPSSKQGGQTYGRRGRAAQPGPPLPADPRYSEAETGDLQSTPVGRTDPEDDRSPPRPSSDGEQLTGRPHPQPAEVGRKARALSPGLSPLLLRP